MRLGRLYEPLILEFASQALQMELTRLNRLRVHPAGVMQSTVDAFVVGQNAIVEAKKVRYQTYLKDKNQWGEEWTDQIPRSYIIQAQHQLHVLSARTMPAFRSSLARRASCPAGLSFCASTLPPPCPCPWARSRTIWGATGAGGAGVFLFFGFLATSWPPISRGPGRAACHPPAPPGHAPGPGRPRAWPRVDLRHSDRCRGP